MVIPQPINTKTMNNIFKNSLKGSLLGAVALFGMYSCADDHFDVVDSKDAMTSNQSIWEVIESGSQFQDLKTILSQTYLMRSETDRINPRTAKTLDALLAEPQSYTVWLPKDGTYDAQEYLDTLASAKREYEANGVTTAFLKKQYMVANQFIYNHVARFNYEGNVDAQEVNLLNGKKVTYEAGAKRFNGIGIESTMVTNNGTLHILEKASPFAYNIYDYISVKDDLDSLRANILDTLVDHYTFSEYASTAGALNQNGDMVYVDSVYLHTNDILDRCNARLQNEDSCYVAVLPTNAAWNNAMTKLKKYFAYRNSYYYEWNSASGQFNNSTATTAYKLKGDSLSRINALAAMVQSAYFSPNRNCVLLEENTDEQILDRMTKADSLYSTNGTLYYNKSKGSVNPIFNGQTPERASNGFIYKVDEYNIEPELVWMRREEINATNQGLMAQPAAAKSHCTTQFGETLSLTAENRDSVVIDNYKVDRYQRFERSGKNEMTVDYRLRNLLSGSYTIKAILLPSRVNYNVYPDSTVEKSVFYAQVLDDQGKALPIEIGNNGTSTSNKARTPEITVDQDEVKMYTLIERIDIPYCYYNLPSGVNSFCRLRLTSEYDKKLKDGVNGTGLNIYKIIIEPYREGATEE